MLTPEEKNARMGAERAVLKSLLEAAVAGDFVQIQTVTEDYLKKNMDVSVIDVMSQFKDAQKRMVLHYACQSRAVTTMNTKESETNDDTNTKDIVEQLIDWLPAEAICQILRCQDEQGLTPIMIAAQCYDKATSERRVLAMLEADSHAMTMTTTARRSCPSLCLGRSKAGATPLHYAAANGLSATIVTALVQSAAVGTTATTAAAAVDIFSNVGGTPLHWACAVPPPSDHTEAMAALLGHGANINASNNTIPPPLAVAMAAGNDRHAKCLLESNRDMQTSIDFVLQPGNVTMLHMAADMNLPGTLALLLTKKHETDDQDSMGLSEVLQQRNDDGYTPLDLAAKERHTGCVLLLLAAATADANATNINTNINGGKGTPTEQDAREFIAHWKAKSPGAVSASTGTSVDAMKPPNPHHDTEDPIEARAKEDAASVQQEFLTGGSSTIITDDQKKLAQQHKVAGNVHYSQQQWADAVVEYTAAIAIDPTDATYYSNRSACYCTSTMLLMSAGADEGGPVQPTTETEIKKANAERALHDAIVARCLRPDWPKAYYRVAVAQLALGRYEDAAVSAWQGLERDSGSQELKRLLQTCVKQGRHHHHHHHNPSKS